MDNTNLHRTALEIASLAAIGFDDWQSLGRIYTKRNGDLLLFNYTARAQIDGEWTPAERVCRGLIVDAVTGVIVALPFEKFFNWGEGGRISTAPVVAVEEKVDGSLGILYRHGGEYKIATRGSFDGEQAVEATRMLNGRNLNFVPSEYTLLFEVVYPENRIVVDYGGVRELVLLAARNRHTGEYASRAGVDYIASEAGFRRPKVYPASTADEVLAILSSLDGNAEGYVIEFADGQRFKFKGDRYKELHRLVSGLTFNRALEAVKNGTVDEIRQSLPDEFLLEFNNMVGGIEDHVLGVMTDVKLAYEIARDEDRKLFANIVNRRYKSLAPYLFAMADGKDIRPIILKREYK